MQTWMHLFRYYLYWPKYCSYAIIYFATFITIIFIIINNNFCTFNPNDKQIITVCTFDQSTYFDWYLKQITDNLWCGCEKLSSP